MEEHMQRKLLGVCYWTSVILGTKMNRFHSSNRSTREKYLFAVPPGDSARVCALDGLYRHRNALCNQGHVTNYDTQESSPEPQRTALKVYFQVICTYLPVIPKLIG